jgi:hypothetical protein
MNWVNAGVFSIIGGLGIGFLIASSLLTAGDCSIGEVAKALMFGLPIGNVFGIGFYKKVFLNALTKSDVVGGVLGLILSGLGALAGLFAMDTWGSYTGLGIVLFASCLGSVLGYSMGSKIMVWYQERW